MTYIFSYCLLGMPNTGNYYVSGLYTHESAFLMTSEEEFKVVRDSIKAYETRQTRNSITSWVFIDFNILLITNNPSA